jgi:hypothetical protein
MTDFRRAYNSCGHLSPACLRNQMKQIAGAVVPMQQRVAPIKVFPETPKLNNSQRRKRNREQHMLQTNSQIHGSSSQSSHSLRSCNATLRDRLPFSGASVNTQDAYVNQSAIGSPYGPNPTHMSYEDDTNSNDIELNNINKVF